MSLIFVTRKIPSRGTDLLRAAGHEVDVFEFDRVMSKEELFDALSKKPYDALLSLLTDTIDEGVLEHAPSLKIISNYAVGFNNINLDAARHKGVVVANTPTGELFGAVAEFAFTAMLALAHRVVEADNFTRSGEWRGWGPELLLGKKISGKTLGIVGAGHIGARVADMAKSGLGMDVAYYDIRRDSDLESRGVRFVPTLEELLSMSDVVMLHVPLLPLTHHLINKERIALMKKTAFLINTSRGPIVDEKALVEALSSGVIDGAALDVFEGEPLVTKELLAMKNVILTPHIASATHEARDEMAVLAAENIIEFFNREPVKNRVV